MEFFNVQLKGKAKNHKNWFGTSHSVYNSHTKNCEDLIFRNLTSRHKSLRNFVMTSILTLERNQECQPNYWNGMPQLLSFLLQLAIQIVHAIFICYCSSVSEWQHHGCCRWKILEYWFPKPFKMLILGNNGKSFGSRFFWKHLPLVSWKDLIFSLTPMIFHNFSLFPWFLEALSKFRLFPNYLIGRNFVGRNY